MVILLAIIFGSAFKNTIAYHLVVNDVARRETTRSFTLAFASAFRADSMASLSVMSILTVEPTRCSMARNASSIRRAIWAESVSKTAHWYALCHEYLIKLFILFQLSGGGSAKP
jgi:hypothetical protein